MGPTIASHFFPLDNNTAGEYEYKYILDSKINHNIIDYFVKYACYPKC